MVIQFLRRFYFRLPIFIRLISTVLLVMVVFGVCMRHIEPEQFPTYFDGIWWAFVTASTVGYGDLIPETLNGKILAVILILSGAGLVSIYLSTIAASTVQYTQNLSKGLTAFKGTNHIIIVGWNERARSLLKRLGDKHPELPVVLIDRTLTSLPYKKHALHFIRGDASEDKTLEKANIQHAKAAIITANTGNNEKQSDYMTIMTTIAMRGNNTELTIIAEVLTESQKENVRRAGADTVIRSNDFVSTLFYHELFHKETKSHLELLLHFLQEQEIRMSPLPQELVDASFFEVTRYFARKDKTAIGFMRGDTIDMSPDFQEPMQAEDSIITLQHIK
ncbi:voltage-gated potassium channel [Terribacillus aidingensis]|uniref:Voltage-gated potassium channel n=1 Tax=Terribacillus aidingensis TaxID=586416 RepID=A0A285NDF0_9BACI|nr:potassium channel family protein [Terribacillus aidingensis]SNZ05946.1 voltage-gated potassium channel [Terribacillus aidingensis]